MKTNLEVIAKEAKLEHPYFKEMKEHRVKETETKARDRRVSKIDTDCGDLLAIHLPQEEMLSCGNFHSSKTY